MTADDRLAAFLGEEPAPARPAVDALFVAQVMQQVARRELSLAVASTAATAVAAGAVLWACAPVLNLAVGALAPALAPAAAVLTVVAAVSLFGGQMLNRR